MGLLNRNKKVEEVKEIEEIKEEIKSEVPPIAPAQAPEMEIYEPEDEAPVVEETKEEETTEEVPTEEPVEGEEQTGEVLQPELSYEMVMQGFENMSLRIQNLEATIYRLKSI